MPTAHWWWEPLPSDIATCNIPLQRLEVGRLIIRGHLATGPCALLFGSEKFGLSNQDMSHCHWLMHIPTRDEHASMNLGQAVAICLYELARDPAALAEPEKGSPASAAEVERITETLLTALRASAYPKLNSSDSFHGAVRRLVRRLHLQTGGRGIPARDAAADGLENEENW